jgi:hypothetical protein
VRQQKPDGEDRPIFDRQPKDPKQIQGKIFYDFPACYYRFHLEAPVRFRSSICCGIEHGGVNDTDSKYVSLAFYYVRDRAGLTQTDAVAFSGPGVETLENFFEGDDDALVKRAILKTKEPVERILKIDPSNAGVRLRGVLDQVLPAQVGRMEKELKAHAVEIIAGRPCWNISLPIAVFGLSAAEVRAGLLRAYRAGEDSPEAEAAAVQQGENLPLVALHQVAVGRLVPVSAPVFHAVLFGRLKARKPGRSSRPTFHLPWRY